MEKKTDIKTVKVTGGEYFTAQNMANYLGVTPKVINMRLFRLGIKPIAKDALYPASALDAIRDVTMGRPKKIETEAKTIKSAKKPAKKGKK
jgi:Zn-dependent peptidase ImmA (M78 family)